MAALKKRPSKPGAEVKEGVMGKRSILITALVVGIVVPLGAGAGASPFTGYPAEATVIDEGQSVQSDGGGVYSRRDGDDTYVILVDSSRPPTPDYFQLKADASGESNRVLHLSIPGLVDTDCATGAFRVFSNSNPNWFNAPSGTVSPGSADLDCDGGRDQGSYKVTWSGCVDITSIAKEHEFNYKPRSSCTASVKRSQGGPPMSFELSVPFDITARTV